jgi:hypothetical protein
LARFAAAFVSSHWKSPETTVATRGVWARTHIRSMAFGPRFPRNDTKASARDLNKPLAFRGVLP